jgi:hypothetical protein
MRLLGSVTGWVVGLLGVSGCVASRGPLVSHDGGADAGDAHAEAEASVCVAPSGGNDLSFDLVCTGDCVVSAHVDFHLDKTSPSYPGCAEGEYMGKGVFQFPNLSGNDQSTLQLNVQPYAGAGTYGVSQKPGLFSFQASPTPEAGATCDITALIPEFMPDSALFDEAGVAPSSCAVVVTSDCADGLAHTVIGTLECTLPNAASGASCTLTHGKFSFGDCTP